MNYLKALTLIAVTFVLYGCPQQHDDQTGNFFIDNQIAETLFIEITGVDNTITATNNNVLAGEQTQFFTATQSNGLAPSPSDYFETLIIRTETDTLYNSVNNDDWTTTNITSVSRDLILTIE